ncbi:MAG: hypothetical protein IPM13_17440 [Phycisphaerales bacterium]|nr:hypothetical protein [Phycisphaerales bacterium]
MARGRGSPRSTRRCAPPSRWRWSATRRRRSCANTSRAGTTSRARSAAARARGLLEADPTLDLDGSDAAAKLALVCAVLWGARLDPGTIARPHADALDPAAVFLAARSGRACRLVARAGRGGSEPRVAWEALPPGSPLAVPSDRVAYAYADAEENVRLHVGSALGAHRTAAALLDDVVRAVGAARVRGAA